MPPSDARVYAIEAPDEVPSADFEYMNCVQKFRIATRFIFANLPLPAVVT